MSRSNLKFSITFDFDLEAPAGLLQSDQDTLRKTIQELLGAMVLQGMPTVTAKQLAKAAVSIVSHRHSIDVVNLHAVEVPRELITEAAPHLTDEELSQVAQRVQGRLPVDRAEQIRVLRRHALALVSDFRTVPCTVIGVLVAGNESRLEGKLNLTNGAVLLAEADRQKRLQPNQAVRVQVGEPAITLPAQCPGNTMSGPVIELALSDVAAQRDALIALWQKPRP